MTDNTDSKFTKLVIFTICKSLRRSDNDRLTCMDTQRVEVFHVTNSDTVVEAVAHNLIFHFLPSLQTLFNQDLRRERESFFGKHVKFFFVVAETRTKSSKRISSTNNYRIAKFLSGTASILNVFYSLTLDCLDIDFIKLLNEEFAVFSIHNSLYRSTKNLSVIFFENTIFIKSHTTVKRSLSAERKQHSIRTFLSDNLLYKVRSNRKEVNLIGYTF